MKELHNHIFSNTTCISKETMLRYINKQLSKSELYKVEKHMLDCELCSDAYEGMQFATNSSILFAIDNQIDQRVGAGNSKAPIIRNLMVAASILVIVFGAYFTFDYFNNAVNNDTGLAINEIEKSKQVAPIEEKAVEEDIDMIAQGNLAAKEEKMQDQLQDEEEGIEDGKYRAEVNIPEPILTEQSEEINNSFGYIMEDEIVEVEEEVTVSAKVTLEGANKAKGENEKLESLGDAVNTADIDNRRKDDDFTTVLESEPVTTSNEVAGFAFNEPATDKSGEALKKEVKKSKSKERSSTGKKRFKSNAKAPAFAETISIEEPKGSVDRNQQKTIVIDSYKVVDYSEEYQKEYDSKNVNVVETKSVSAGFETKSDKDEADKEKEGLIVEITYKETLERGIKLYKNKKYTQAIEEFDVILKEHPDEVNGLFYGGLSNYHLQRYEDAKGKLNLVLKNEDTSFNEEAKWYKALTLIELKQIDQAKKILQEIDNTKGFYKSKAKEKLKEL